MAFTDVKIDCLHFCSVVPNQIKYHIVNTCISLLAAIMSMSVSMSINIFSVAKIAEPLRSPQRRSRVTI